MTLINDVHISHATDFPYPQHMNSCVTCHKGKMGDAALNDVFADAKFKPSNCITCHGVEGLKGKMAAANYNHAGFISQMDDPATRDSVSCRNCHASGDVQADTGTAGVNGGGTPFATIHNNGYDPLIYASDGTRYASDATAETPVSLASKSTEPRMTPPPHAGYQVQRDRSEGQHGCEEHQADRHHRPVRLRHQGLHRRRARFRSRRQAESGTCVRSADNPRYTDVTYAGNGSWETQVDLSLWAAMLDSADPSNPALKPVIRRAEIAVLPELRDASNNVIGLNAPSKTFNFADDEFERLLPGSRQCVQDGKHGPRLPMECRKDTGNKGSLDGCNTCHDQLATTFHSGIRGGNIKVCRICHEVSNGGAHLEAQSRSIDSYVHAIHSFQAFNNNEPELRRE